MHLIFQKLILITLFLISCVLIWGSTAQAQSSWNTPENISYTPTHSSYPAIVADSSGMVHTFWTENLSQFSTFNNAIFYTRFDGVNWSHPVDIMLSPEGIQAMASEPAVAVGPDGQLHLVFVGGFNGKIYYSSAPIEQAGNAMAWRTPIEIGSGAINSYSPNVSFDTQGDLHVVYHTTQGERQGIYHLQSADNGDSWSIPDLVPGSQLGNNTLLGDTRMAVAADGTIHITWMWTTVEELFPPNGIYYVRSSDSNSGWKTPVVIKEGPYRYPDVATVGKDEVHLVWSGTHPNRFKFSQHSSDGGLTWSGISKIPNLGGFQGYSGMDVDSLDRLHLGMAASDSVVAADALIHSTWDGRLWAIPDPLLLNRIPENNLQNADIAISEGNIAHLVVMYPIETSKRSSENNLAEEYQFEIYYVRGVLDSPHISPQPMPSPEVVLTETVAVLANPIGQNSSPTPTPVRLPNSLNNYSPGLGMNSSSIILIATIPLFLIWIVVIILRKGLIQRR